MQGTGRPIRFFTGTAVTSLWTESGCSGGKPLIIRNPINGRFDELILNRMGGEKKYKGREGEEGGTRWGHRRRLSRMERGVHRQKKS